MATISFRKDIKVNKKEGNILADAFASKSKPIKVEKHSKNSIPASEYFSMAKNKESYR